ncbi:MAG TPA: glycosyltransferase family 4 protein [Burkholderiales bacterium]|nr:glycosyltransferase family 4 protein [Burkholderiales bacterium]
MRVAIVAPLYESVPPRLYGGTERVVSYLTEELVAQGHEVTLFATADSRTRARLRPMAPQGLRLDPGCRDAMAYHLVMLDHVFEAAREFDIVHFHLDYLQLPLARRLPVPSLTTMHSRLDLPELQMVHRRFTELPLVSISEAQRRPMAWANWLATVHHGLPPQLYPFGARPGSYLAFLGRISPEKRPDRAIRLARAVGIPLKIAAKIEKLDQQYFEEVIRPMLNGPGVEFVGEIGEAEKRRFLGDALALLFPIDWPEPFGLVMIEAMACGTPVLAWRCGSVPEIMVNGVTGFVVDDERGAAAAIGRIGTLDRAACRRVFEERFSAQRMAREYLSVYRRLLEPPEPRASRMDEQEAGRL